jgi:hypothetical protein
MISFSNQLPVYQNWEIDFCAIWVEGLPSKSHGEAPPIISGLIVELQPACVQRFIKISLSLCHD